MPETSSSKLQTLLDRQAIRDCIYRYARAVDRHDEELIATVFHADAVDNHGAFVGRVPHFIEWVNGLHEARCISHSHNITCHIHEINGDVAHAESYICWVLSLRDGRTVHVGSGRYLDRLERRNGEWRISLRRVVTELRFNADAAAFEAIERSAHGTWDRNDPSYQRPIRFPAELQRDLLTGGRLVSPAT